jgi:hypothetical protein
MEGTKENLENLLGAIFFRKELSTIWTLDSCKQKTEQPLSSILALTAFFLSSLLNPLTFQFRIFQPLNVDLCVAIEKDLGVPYSLPDPGQGVLSGEQQYQFYCNISDYSQVSEHCKSCDQNTTDHSYNPFQQQGRIKTK